METFDGLIDFHDELNSLIWDVDKQLKPLIRQKLLKTGFQFHNFLKMPNAKIQDIIILGSLCNYNYTKYSDIDLHIVCDFSEYDSEILAEYLFDKKTIWNFKYDIKIKGFPLELYAQDISEDPKSNGVYSVMHDRWIHVPSSEKPTIDDQSIMSKFKYFKKLIYKLEHDTNISITDINELKDKIKKLRKNGLETGGEYSTENITYKLLRNAGYLDKISNIQKNLLVSELQLEQKL